MKHKNKKILGIFFFTAILSIIAPLLILLVWSFVGRWPWPRLIPDDFTLRGMEEIFFGTSKVLSVLASSILLSLLVAFLAAIIGMMAARAFVFYEFKGKKLFAFGTILPIIVPGTAFGMGVHVVFIYLGMADTYLGVVLVHLIYALPYTINIMIDITDLIGDGLEIQAQVLGVSPMDSFRHISLPLLMPGFLSSVSMAYIISFSQYFLTLMIGGGKVKTLSIIMVPFIQGGDRTIAAAYALLFILSSLAVFILLEVVIKRFTVRLSQV